MDHNQATGDFTYWESEHLTDMFSRRVNHPRVKTTKSRQSDQSSRSLPSSPSTVSPSYPMQMLILQHNVYLQGSLEYNLFKDGLQDGLNRELPSSSAPAYQKGYRVGLSH